MAQDITNGILLEHMQGMKNDLQQQIGGVNQQIGGIIVRMDRLEGKITRLEQKVDEGFDDARLHRQALQEDLEATITLQAKHGAKLARL